MSRPTFDLYRHDAIEQLAQDEARRRGWTAEARGRDIDPEHRGSTTRSLPGAGSLVLRCGSRMVAIPYHLPESSALIIDAVDDAVGRSGRYARACAAG